MSRGYSITQLWGDNVDYYEKFHGAGVGHPAVDCVYQDGKIVALYPGKVVKDDDDQRTDLGVTVTYWIPELNIAFKHCHMERNLVDNMDWVEEGQIIGIMGKSQTKYAHDHLECIVTDDYGYRQKHVGVWGRIDPLFHVLRKYGDPTFVDYKEGPGDTVVPVPWDEWQKKNPEWVRGKYIYGPSTL